MTPLQIYLFGVAAFAACAITAIRTGLMAPRTPSTAVYFVVVAWPLAITITALSLALGVRR